MTNDAAGPDDAARLDDAGPDDAGPDDDAAAFADSLAIIDTQRPGEFPGALGHAAVLATTLAICAWMAGAMGPAVATLTEQRRWLRRSLSADESFGDEPLLMSAQVADALALTTWLLDGRDDPSERHAAIGRYESYLAHTSTPDPDVVIDLARLRATDRLPLGDADVLRAEELLAARGPTWRVDGNAIRLAGWLKLRYWDTGLADTAAQTLRHAPRARPAQ